MSIDSPLALPLVLIFALAAAWLLLKVPFYARLHADGISPGGGGGGGRFATLDGYRGYLALSVVVFHAYCQYFLVRGATLDDIKEPFFLCLGKAAVAQFFLITGLLFWNKAIDGKVSILSPQSTLSHYVSRAFRLGPLYLLAAGIILVVVAFQSHFALQVSVPRLLGQIARLSLLGLDNTKQINGIDTTAINGVRWTLHYEWVFYLALPFLALLATHRRFLAYCAGVVVAFVIMQVLLARHVVAKNPLDSFAIWLFLGGMATAHILRIFPHPRLWRSAWLVAPMAVLASIIALFIDANSPLGLLINVLIFIPIAGGNSLFGLLHLRPSRFLSTISYSIYLMHPFILNPMRELVRAKGIELSPLQHWLVACGLTVVVVCASALTYRYFEHPFLHRKLRIKTELVPAAAVPETAASAAVEAPVS